MNRPKAIGQVSPVLALEVLLPGAKGEVGSPSDNSELVRGFKQW